MLLSTVGPFVRWGEPAVRGRDRRGRALPRLDGRGAVHPARLRALGPAAPGPRASALLTAMGYDWVPGNLAGGAGAAPRRARRRARSTVGYFITGGGMGAAHERRHARRRRRACMLEPGYTFRGGRIVAERGGARVRAFDASAGARAGDLRRRRPSTSRCRASSPGAARRRRLPRLVRRRVAPAAGAVARRRRWRPGCPASAARSAPRCRGLVKGSTGGPDAEARAKSGSLVVAEAPTTRRARAGRPCAWRASTATTSPPTCSPGRAAAAAGGLQGTGALGPVDGFGLDALQAGVAAAGSSRGP